MKKIAILLGLTASFFMFAGCVSKAATDVGAQPEAKAPANFKGEAKEAK
jgi:hypothetical protein